MLAEKLAPREDDRVYLPRSAIEVVGHVERGLPSQVPSTPAGGERFLPKPAKASVTAYAVALTAGQINPNSSGPLW